jgi:hypothetical protein
MRKINFDPSALPADKLKEWKDWQNVQKPLLKSFEIWKGWDGNTKLDFKLESEIGRLKEMDVKYYIQ